ncbi:MAG: S8 family serine peptidase [Pyrinomonadaceae bacterium]
MGRSRLFVSHSRLSSTLFLCWIFFVSFLVPFARPPLNVRRIAPKRAAQTTVAAARRDGELLVQFRPGISELQKNIAASSHGLQRKKVLRGGAGIEKLQLASGQNIETAALQLMLDPSVEFAEPNFLINKDQLATTPDDPRFREQWALRNVGQESGQYGSDINAVGAWQTTTGMSSVVVAVIDSGIDFTHPDLLNTEWRNQADTVDGLDEEHDGYVDDMNGWDFTNDSGVIRDEQGHGTAVGGLIAAQGNNGLGVSGVMWSAKLMSLRVLDASGTGDVGNAVEAIDYAASHGAQVINLSWGTSGNSLILKDAIERAIRHGVAVVCSAGNNGQDVDNTAYYPASFGSRDLVAVAATDNLDQLASWSNFGQRNVTVAAPGTNILTTQIGGGYWAVTGTSASAPLVSGVVGLLKSVNPALNVQQTVKAISDGARKITSLTDKVSSGGVLDAAATLQSIRGNPYAGIGGGNSNGNGTGQGNGQGYVPPALRPDNSGSRGYGVDGLRVTSPPTVEGAPLVNLPDLAQSRKVRTSPTTTAPSAPIQSNLICADCDPGGGGGAGGTDPYFSTTRSQPGNRTGQVGVTLGSRNFNWSLPIVGLKGRSGLDLSISLYYNSLVWTEQGAYIQYNADHGTPAPGFQIGLPRLQTQYFDNDDSAYAYILITPSGGRVELKQVGTTSVYESSDGSFMQLTFSGSTPILKTTDGTQLVYGTAVSGEWRCTKIEDRNGNYISATYNTTNGHLLSLTDTLSRVVNFNYNTDGNLETITQSWAGTPHTWATFVYGSVLMSFSFTGLTAIGATNNTTKTVLSSVAFPEGTTYNFDYNSYGQVYQIRHKAPDGHELEHTLYTINTAGAQSDCPRVTDRRDYALDWNNNQEAINTYAVTTNATWTNPETNIQQTGTLVQQTAPDGTVYKEYSNASGWDAGMPRLTEFWSGGARKKWTSTAWTQDNTALTYPQNPRVFEVNIYDEAGNRRRTTIDYTSYNLPSAVKEWTGAGATTLYRQTATGYRFDGEYLNRRIIGLVDNVQVTDGAGGLVSKVTYGYDWDFNDLFEDTPAPATQHDRTNYGPTLVYGRGNLSQMSRFNIDDPQNQNGTITETKWRVNSTGTMVMIRDHLWHQTFFDYADAFSDAVNRNTFAYPTKVTDAEANYSTVQYNYDFGAVTRTHAPTSGTAGTTTYVDEVRTYDVFGRLNRATNQTNSAYVYFVYDLNANYVHTYQTIIDLTQANEFHSWQIMDGAGRVRATASDHPGSVGGLSGQYVVYDNMGRVSQQSNSTEMNGSWAPAGDDTLWRITTQAYDWKGRPTQTTKTDGTTQIASYGGCGCAGGEVTTLQDEHGRKRRLTKDGFGRLAKVEEMNWDGTTVYATTTYSYNLRDQLTQSNQAGQLRSFDYDGHGRLWHRTTPEQGTTTFTYNQDDTTNVVTDARGATTTFGYNPRHLVTSLTYGVPAGVAATANVSFAYDAAGHRTSMTDGLGSMSYSYNNLGQLQSEARTFTGVGTYTLTYGYNLAGELSSITNPWSAQVGYNYDKAGRVTSVTGSGYYGISSYASAFTYRAFGALKGMSYGDARSLSTTYDSRLRPTTWNVANVLGYNYAYDYSNEHTGRVTYAQNIQDSTLDRSYEYDQVGRLAISHSGAEARAATGQGPWNIMDGPYSQGYDYDVWGSVTHKYGWGGEVQGGGAGQSSDIYYTYANNRRNGFSYDASGNLTNDLGQQFTYDATGQQTASTYTNLQNFYDGDGLRVKRTEDGLLPTLYLRSSVLGGQVVAEITLTNGSWQWNRGYVYRGSQLLAVQQGGVYWMHEDPITKSKRITNSSGTIVSTIELDPWGADTSRSSNGAFQPKKFTSYERDGNGSDEAMFRRYNRWHSRFDQPDPYDGSYDSADPQSLNRYSYVQNDSPNSVDPTGLTTYDGASDPHLIGQALVGGLTWALQHGGVLAVNTGIRIGDEILPNWYFSWQQNPQRPSPTPNPRQEFKNFLQTMSQDCKDALRNAGLLGTVSNLANTAQVYDVNNLQNARASTYVNGLARGRETLGQWFDRNTRSGGANTVVHVPHSGVYVRGGESAFAGHMYLELHEMTHLAYPVGRDLDASLGRKLVLTKGANESWSDAVSRFFSSQCTKKTP